MVVEFCKDKSDITVHSTKVEQPHRIGKYDSALFRPVIAKFAFFNDQRRIIERGSKLKGADFAVREDFSLQTFTLRLSL